jgi:hypothetical protein
MFVIELMTRTLLFKKSAKTNLTELELAPSACRGLLMNADVAGPPSPIEPAVPAEEPAYRVMAPEEAEILRILFPPLSETNKSPFLSPHTDRGALTDADVAGPPSPVELATPVPIAVLMHDIVGDAVVVGVFVGVSPPIKCTSEDARARQTAIHRTNNPRVNSEGRKPVLKHK